MTVGTPSPARTTTTSTQRRLEAEWTTLLDLAALNPGRLADPTVTDTTMHVHLLATPALRLDGTRAETHQLRVDYPRFFPSVPLELYLAEPVFHPNIHPHTGFVCLWETHRTANSIEHALHKTAAILGWRLLSLDAPQVMQPAAAALDPAARDGLIRDLAAPLLQGIAPSPYPLEPAAQPRRRRLP